MFRVVFNFTYYIIIKTMTIINMTILSIYKLKKSNSHAVISLPPVVEPKKGKEEIIKKVELEEINKKVNQIKTKVEENEIKLIEYEKNIKMADLEIKKYEYEYKIVEIKGNIITECASILKKIISIIDKESL